MKRKLKKKRSPAQVLVIFFFILITCGALLLNTRIATISGERIGLLDAYFTSTSAVCVTGLVVVDTGTTFTIFGKTVIMMLIQFGALGIMTAASLMYILLRGKISISDKIIMTTALNQDTMAFLEQTVMRIIKMTIIIESIGAILLSFRFIPMYGLFKGGYYSIFHAVSAFCNAGFDLNGGFSSLTSFANDPLVVITISILIILGGIGFAVIQEAITFKKNKKLSLHGRVVILCTLALIVFGTVAFYMFEMRNTNTIGDPNMGFGTKLLSAYFQSVTTRTAGFNTIDQLTLTMPSKLLTIGLMFIGASPASTGGGIKTTTFAIMMMTIWANITGKEDIEFKYKRISQKLALDAFVIAIVGFIFVMICAIGIVVFESGVALTFEDVLYEAFSAFGTVGLSTGITPSLSAGSKAIVILTMFAGRVGPLTLTMAIVGTRKQKKLIKNIESNIMIG